MQNHRLTSNLPLHVMHGDHELKDSVAFPFHNSAKAQGLLKDELFA